MDDAQPNLPSSGDSFSFPSTPTPDSDFEFGALTPDSPSAEPFATSPADHLFLNGRLRPHPFPLPASRASSTRDSLLSSRSNSTNSSCSSARTSSSDSSERRSFHSKVKGAAIRASANSSHYQAYGCSQRWQYITPVPALNRDGSRRRDTKQVKNKEEGTKTNHHRHHHHHNNNKKKKKSKNKKETVNKGVRLRFGRRILRWFVMTCRECHAMEPSPKARNKEI